MMRGHMLFERKPRLPRSHTGFVCSPFQPPVFLFRGYPYSATKTVVAKPARSEWAP